MKPDFSKHNLIPAIVQDANTNVVLMLGYMNEEAFAPSELFTNASRRLFEGREVVLQPPEVILFYKLAQ